jgi:hypothetical protein
MINLLLNEHISKISRAPSHITVEKDEEGDGGKDEGRG